MNPILIQIGPLVIYAFGVMIISGVLVSLFLMLREVRTSGVMGPNEVYDLIFAALFAGLVGSRFAYVVQYADWYVRHPSQIFAFWEGGLIFYGGVIGAFAALLTVMRIKKIRVIQGLDFLAPYIALTTAFGRVGCFLNGCCGGRECNLPWAVVFPGRDAGVHPTQLYSSLFNLILFLLLRWRSGRKAFDGEIFLLYFIGYAAGRFCVEFYRAGNPGWFFLTYNQWASVVIFVVSVGAYAAFSRTVKPGKR